MYFASLRTHPLSLPLFLSLPLWLFSAHYVLYLSTLHPPTHHLSLSLPSLSLSPPLWLFSAHYVLYLSTLHPIPRGPNQQRIKSIPSLLPRVPYISLQLCVLFPPSIHADSTTHVSVHHRDRERNRERKQRDEEAETKREGMKERVQQRKEAERRMKERERETKRERQRGPARTLHDFGIGVRLPLHFHPNPPPPLFPFLNIYP